MRNILAVICLALLTNICFGEEVTTEMPASLGLQLSQDNSQNNASDPGQNDCDDCGSCINAQIVVYLENNKNRDKVIGAECEKRYAQIAGYTVFNCSNQCASDNFLEDLANTINTQISDYNNNNKGTPDYICN